MNRGWPRGYGGNRPPEPTLEENLAGALDSAAQAIRARASASGREAKAIDKKSQDRAASDFRRAGLDIQHWLRLARGYREELIAEGKNPPAIPVDVVGLESAARKVREVRPAPAGAAQDPRLPPEREDDNE